MGFGPLSGLPGSALPNPHLPELKRAVAQRPAAFERLQEKVIRPGLCTHCGGCAGLSDGQLQMEQTPYGPLPRPVTSTLEKSAGLTAIPMYGLDKACPDLPELAYSACPGKGLDYPALNEFVFGHLPQSWLTGTLAKVFIGYSNYPEVRHRGASGGVITQTLIYLLEQGLVDGAVVLQQGRPSPWLASPVIARSSQEVLAASQSVYIPSPVNTLLGEMETFSGDLAYVGLPDQVASLRYLQKEGHPATARVRYVIGPYVGTAFYVQAIASYLRSNGIASLEEIAELRYREGAWPGYLQIRTHKGRVLQASKFYYNYLIPFYITRASLVGVDFTNELTDISVGDAWHPRYEGRGGGFSVVMARTERGLAVLEAMRARGMVTLEESSLEDALSMHGHMLDFKKRGAFIRIGWRKARGLAVPEYGYAPKRIPTSRFLVEAVISGLFAVCGTRFARRLVEWVPLRVIGPLFNTARRTWKRISRPTKRKGLWNMRFQLNGEGSSYTGDRKD